MKKLFVLKTILQNLGLKTFAEKVYKEEIIYKKAISLDVANDLKKWFNNDYSKLSFNKVFDGKLRKMIPLNTENIKFLFEIVSALKKNGWTPTFTINEVEQRQTIPGGEQRMVNSNVADLRVKKEINRVIPSGPKQGQTETRTKILTISKAIELPELSISQDTKNWWAKNQTMYAHDKNWENIENLFNENVYYEEDEAGKIYGEKKYIILSRDPIDVLKMSDHENIESCHSEGHSHFHCALAESRGAGIISYVVTEDELKNLLKRDGIDAEKVNFDDFDISYFDDKEIFKDYDRKIDGITPTSRVRLRKVLYSPEKRRKLAFFVPEERVYGFKIPGLTEALRSWSWDSQKKVFQNSDGQIEIPKTSELTTEGGSYFDNSSNFLVNKLLETGSKKDNFENTFAQNESLIAHDDFNENKFDIIAIEVNNARREIRQILNKFNSNHQSNIRFDADVDNDGDFVIYSASVDLKIKADLYGWKDWELDDSGQYVLDPSDESPETFSIDIEDFYKHVFRKINERSGNFDMDINRIDDYKQNEILSIVFNLSITQEVYSTFDIDMFFSSFGDTSNVDNIAQEYLSKNGIVKNYVENLVDLISPNDFENLNITNYNKENIKYKLVLEKNNLPNIIINYYDEVFKSKTSFFDDNFQNYFGLSNLLMNKEIYCFQLKNKDKIINTIIEEIKDIQAADEKQLKFDFYKTEDTSKQFDLNLIKDSISASFCFEEIKADKFIFSQMGFILSKVEITINIESYKIKDQLSSNSIKFMLDVLNKNINNIISDIIADFKNKASLFNENKKTAFEDELDSTDIAVKINELCASEIKEIKMFGLWLKFNWNLEFTPEQKFALKEYYLPSIVPNSLVGINWNERSYVPRPSSRMPFILYNVFENFNGKKIKDVML